MSVDRSPPPGLESAVAATPVSGPLGAAHRRRLRELWRSAGWPVRDVLEAELLSFGLLRRCTDGEGRETLQLTDAGIAALAQTLQRNRAARDAHEALVERVARELQRGGRLVWRGLSLRARVDEDPVPALPLRPRRAAARARDVHSAALPGLEWAMPPAHDGTSGAPSGPGGDGGAQAVLAAADVGTGTGGDPAPADGPAPPSLAADGRWAVVMPDVYSIRQSSVEAFLVPTVHEIKVRRADLLADLRKTAKGEAYRWLSAECWYVLAEGIADVAEIPPVYGVMVAPRDGGALQVLRPAPARALPRLPFMVWMALARAMPEGPADEAAQAWLGGAIADGAASPACG
ncbi:MAG: hypothetical protein RL223_2543 [Pseudomonadota bacterium]|jgi:hypothetical protein